LELASSNRGGSDPWRFAFPCGQASSRVGKFDREVLHQVEKLFPNQINAVVEENGKVDLLIAQSPMMGFDQPVLLVFKRGRDSIRVLSYSGHHVCLMLDKTENCFEILATPTGGIILESDDKVWLASEHPKVAGYSVRAQTLEASL
jgi:hypothetical protein